MCNGIDDGYSMGMSLDPDLESTRVLIVGDGGAGMTALSQALLSLEPELLSPVLVVDNHEIISEHVIKPLRYEMPERVNLIRDKRTPAQRCDYSTKFK